MSAQFALDPALASNTPSTDNPTASPANLTKSPSKHQSKQQPQNQNPGYYSILPALPPLPGWGPFPGPMFSAMPHLYLVPQPPPGAWPVPGLDMAQPPVQAPPQVQPLALSPAPTPAPVPAPAPTPPKPATQAQPQPPLRPRRVEPPPINPAATISPHYQNPGGFGGVYSPPNNSGSTNNASGSNSDPAPPGSHYTHKPNENPQPLTDLGRPFACGINGCGAAFDRKSDCERHRRTHAKGGSESRPFKCSRVGCEAAFDRKDALMRHERNERTHLVRQTQPGRIKRPTRTPSKTDETTPTPDPPRRMSTRRRKTVPSMYVDASESDFDEDDEDIPNKRAREDGSGSGNEGLGGGGNGAGNNMEDMVVIPPDEQLVIDPALHGLGPSPSHGRPGGGYAGLSNQVTQTPTGDWVLFHPVYTPEELKSVSVFHSIPATLGDKIAQRLVKLCRWGFDFVSGYKYKPIPPGTNMSIAELRKGGYVMHESEWLMRILFLESIAAVPGMVAATIRHLRSLRLMKRDAGWIHTLLEEAENERMHLMTFMTLKHPSVLFRALILGAQGVFYNAFFLAYILSPKSAHRFVGYLEEEAVSTYTRCIAEIEAGRIPEWTNKPAPAIAIDYWRLPSDAKLLDVIKSVRADESTHRFVNHSLANLKQTEDLNPFAIREPDMFVKGNKPGFTREESAAFVDESRKILEQVKH